MRADARSSAASRSRPRAVRAAAPSSRRASSRAQRLLQARAVLELGERQPRGRHRHRRGLRGPAAAAWRDARRAEPGSANSRSSAPRWSPLANSATSALARCRMSGGAAFLRRQQQLAAPQPAARRRVRSPLRQRDREDQARRSPASSRRTASTTLRRRRARAAGRTPCASHSGASRRAAAGSRRRAAAPASRCRGRSGSASHRSRLDQHHDWRDQAGDHDLGQHAEERADAPPKPRRVARSGSIAR